MPFLSVKMLYAIISSHTQETINSLFKQNNNNIHSVPFFVRFLFNLFYLFTNLKKKMKISNFYHNEKFTLNLINLFKIFFSRKLS